MDILIGIILFTVVIYGFMRFVEAIQNENYENWKARKEEETDMLASKLSHNSCNKNQRIINHHNKNIKH